MAKRIIGIEIAEEGIRAVEVSGGRKPVLLAAGEVRLPPGAARDSEVVDADAVAMALNQLWAQAGFRRRNVVLSVANRRLLVREYTAPNLPPRQLKAALPFEVQDLLPVPADRAVMDFYPLAIENHSARGLLVAGPAEGVEGLIAALRQARISVDAVDFLPFGLARALARVVPAGTGPTAVVSVGEHTTSFTTVVDGIPTYVRIMPVDVTSGSRAPVSAQTGPGNAAPHTRSGGAPARSAAVPDASLRELEGRIRETLQFCSRGGNTTTPRQLFLTGAMGTGPDVQAVVRDGIDIEIHPLMPHDIVPVARSLAEHDLPASLTGALGVTLGVTE